MPSKGRQSRTHSKKHKNKSNAGSADNQSRSRNQHNHVQEKQAKSGNPLDHLTKDGGSRVDAPTGGEEFRARGGPTPSAKSVDTLEAPSGSAGYSRITFRDGVLYGVSKNLPKGVAEGYIRDEDTQEFVDRVNISLLKIPHPPFIVSREQEASFQSALAVLTGSPFMTQDSIDGMKSNLSASMYRTGGNWWFAVDETERKTRDAAYKAIKKIRQRVETDRLTMNALEEDARHYPSMPLIHMGAENEHPPKPPTGLVEETQSHVSPAATRTGLINEMFPQMEYPSNLLAPDFVQVQASDPFRPECNLPFPSTAKTSFVAETEYSYQSPFKRSDAALNLEIDGFLGLYGSSPISFLKSPFLSSKAAASQTTDWKQQADRFLVDSELAEVQAINNILHLKAVSFTSENGRNQQQNGECISDFTIDTVIKAMPKPDTIYILPSCCIINENVTGQAESMVRLWKKKAMNPRYLVLPICNGNHWTFHGIDLKEGLVWHYNSAPRYGNQATIVSKLLTSLHPNGRWTNIPTICLRQDGDDHVNCGLYMLLNIETFLAGLVTEKPPAMPPFLYATPWMLQVRYAQLLLRKYKFQSSGFYQDICTELEKQDTFDYLNNGIRHTTDLTRAYNIADMQEARSLVCMDDPGLMKDEDIRTFLDHLDTTTGDYRQWSANSVQRVMRHGWQAALTKRLENEIGDKKQRASRTSDTGFASKKSRQKLDLEKTNVISELPVVKQEGRRAISGPANPRAGQKRKSEAVSENITSTQAVQSFRGLQKKIDTKYLPVYEPIPSLNYAQTMPSYTKSWLEQRPIDMIMTVMRSSPTGRSGFSDNDVQQKSKSAIEEFTRMSGVNSPRTESVYLNGVPAERRFPTVGNLVGRGKNPKEPEKRFVKAICSHRFGSTIILIIMGVEGACIEPHFWAMLWHSYMQYRIMIVVNEQPFRELDCAELWVKGQNSKMIMFPLIALNEAINGKPTHWPETEAFIRQLKMSQEARKALPNSLTRGRNGNRLEQAIAWSRQKMLGILRCRFCSEFCMYNTLPNQAKYITHCRQYHPDFLNSDTKCTVQGCTVDIGPDNESMKTRQWRHLELHYKHAGLEDLMTRLKLTPRMDKDNNGDLWNGGLKCGHDDCSKSFTRFSSEEGIELHFWLHHPMDWEDRLKTTYPWLFEDLGSVGDVTALDLNFDQLDLTANDMLPTNEEKQGDAVTEQLTQTQARQSQKGKGKQRLSKPSKDFKFIESEEEEEEDLEFLPGHRRRRT